MLDKAIKTLGLHKLRVVLHPEVAVQVTVNVAQSAEEAEMQAKGVDPLRLAAETAAREAQEAREAHAGEGGRPRRERRADAPHARRESFPMKVYVFDLMAYGRPFEEFTADRYIPYPLPRKYFDREVAARTFEEHLAAWREMDRLGFDGVGLNEHHTTVHGLMNSPNMMAAVASQQTERLKFLMLGNLLPLHNPLRIAEEIAMADCMSRGRILSGVRPRQRARIRRLRRGRMAESRARFEEAYDIILKAWTEEQFSYEGKFWQMKDVAIWPRPYQQPYPPIWIPFTGSKETIEWTGKNNLSAVMIDRLARHDRGRRRLVRDVVGEART